MEIQSIKRPTSTESDEDLIKQQQLFFQNKSKSSAFSKSSNNKSLNGNNAKISLNAKSITNKEENSLNKLHINNSKRDGENENKEVIKENVLLEVQERILPMDIKLFNDSDGHVNKEKTFNNKKSKSIFAQLKQKKMLADPKKKEILFEKSVLIDGSGLSTSSSLEAEKIHKENLLKLSQMSEQEILQNQQELKEKLSPDLLSFIQNRKKCRASKSIASNESTNQYVEVAAEKNKNENFGLEEEIIKKDDSNKMMDEIPAETKILLEDSSKYHWKNMNNLEKDKLKWMTSLPKPTPVDLKTGYTARFDFEGRLLARNEDRPTYEGLHHHGNEPEVAGYSLEELFLLARSTIQSQRITALQIISRILDQYWYGMLDNCFDTPLLSTLLQSGIVPLLRWALDDTTLSSISAAVAAIHSLLISKPDEFCLQWTFTWLNGHILPILEPQGLDDSKINTEEMTDADIIKLDVIKGFLRIDILPRFMYLLEKLCPPPSVCQLILEICSRLAQHSKKSANEVCYHPGLLQLIFNKFLPLNWSFVDVNQLTETVNFSSPLYSAVKLIRILASLSKELAKYLIETYEVILVIKCYLALQADDNKLTPCEFQKLVIETHKLWHVFLTYGFASQVFFDLFPIFIKQMNFCLNIKLNSNIFEHSQDFQYAEFFFKSLEAVIIFIAENEAYDNFSWNQINIILKKAETCLIKWLWEFQLEISSSHALLLLASCMNFISTYYEKSVKHDAEISSLFLNAKQIIETSLLSCVKSNCFLILLRKLKNFSLLLTRIPSGCKRDGITLVSLGSVLWGDDVVPLIKENSPFPLLISVMKFLIVCRNTFNLHNIQISELIYKESHAYLKEISISNLNAKNWFAHFENYLLYLFLELNEQNMSFDHHICHNIGMSLVSCLKISQEYILQKLLNQIIFNTTHILSIANKHLNLDIQAESKEKFEKAIKFLPSLQHCYISFLSDFIGIQTISKSRALYQRCISELDSSSFLNKETTLMPKHWLYMPILYIYKEIKKKNIYPKSDNKVDLIKSSLIWSFIYICLEKYTSKLVPDGDKFCYHILVFLCDNDIFKDPEIKYWLYACLKKLIEAKYLNLKLFKEDNIPDFDSIYKELLVQYEAVSYGDQLFGSVILFPLQQCYPSHWKKMLFTEHTQALFFLNVPSFQLLVPVNNYLEPLETDFEILREYYHVLTSGMLCYHKCPLLYVMAAYHLHHFLLSSTTSEDHLKTQFILLKSIAHSKKMDVIKLILLLSEVNDTNFLLKEKIPSKDIEHYENIFHKFNVRFDFNFWSNIKSENIT